MTYYLVQQAKFQELRADNVVFIRKSGGASVIILAYVDNLLFFGNTAAALDTAIAYFLTNFDGSAEPLEWYLGVNFKINTDSVQLSQENYIQQALNEFRLLEMKPFSTPMTANFHDEAIFHEKDPVLDDCSFRNMIGVLNILARRTRPDTATSVGILSQFSTRPTRFHINAAKRIFGYLKVLMITNYPHHLPKIQLNSNFSHTLILRLIKLTEKQDQAGSGFEMMVFLCGLLENQYV